MKEYVLSSIIFTPFMGALLVALWPKDERTSGDTMRGVIALVTAVVSLGLSLYALGNFDSSETGLQFSERHSWIQTLNITYALGVDGLSIGLVVLNSLLFLFAFISSWGWSSGSRGYFSLLLLLEGLLQGILCSQDLFLFFIFWQAASIPIYFLVGVWGDKGCVEAATEFFIYQGMGAVFFLLAMFAVYFFAEPHTFGLSELAGAGLSGKVIRLFGQELPFGRVAFAFFTVTFFVRLPIFPFHSWLPKVQESAPKAVSALVAALFVPLAAYGLLRVNDALFPAEAIWSRSFLCILALVQILYGAFCALGQSDMRRILAYMTMSQMGLVLLGICVGSETSLLGSVFHLSTHGIIALLLYLATGTLGQRVGAYDLRNSAFQGGGGFARSIPLLAGIVALGVLAASCLPGLGGFASASMIFIGVFPYKRLFALLALALLPLSVAYLLGFYRTVFLGKGSQESSGKISDLLNIDKYYLYPLSALVVLLGFFPGPIVSVSKSSIDHLVKVLDRSDSKNEATFPTSGVGP